MTPAIGAPRAQTWRLVVAGIVLTVLAAVALIAFAPTAGTPGPVGGGEHAGHPTAADAGGDDGIPLDPLAAVPATAGTTGESSLAAAASTGDGGRDMTTQDGERGPVAPDAILSESSPALGGCLAAYGATGQCLPVIPPSQSAHAQAMTDAGLDPATMQHVWLCSEVRQYFSEGIAVRVAGVDPLELDRSDDGVACGEGD